MRFDARCRHSIDPSATQQSVFRISRMAESAAYLSIGALSPGGANPNSFGMDRSIWEGMASDIATIGKGWRNQDA
jgi:hypothetical protein